MNDVETEEGGEREEDLGHELVDEQPHGPANRLRDDHADGEETCGSSDKGDQIQDVVDDEESA